MAHIQVVIVVPCCHYSVERGLSEVCDGGRVWGDMAVRHVVSLSSFGSGVSGSVMACQCVHLDLLFCIVVM